MSESPAVPSVTVNELHSRVDDTLRVDDDRDGRQRHIVQPACFDDFQPLVRQCRESIVIFAPIVQVGWRRAVLPA